MAVLVVVIYFSFCTFILILDETVHIEMGGIHKLQKIFLRFGSGSGGWEQVRNAIILVANTHSPFDVTHRGRKTTSRYTFTKFL